MTKADILSRVNKSLVAAEKSLNRAKNKPHVSEVELLHLLEKVDFYRSIKNLLGDN